MNAALISLVFGTLISEDLTSIGAGLLVRDGQIALVPAIAACVTGVFAGDLGLWLLGRLVGRRLLEFPYAKRRLTAEMLSEISSSLDARLPAAVFASRFLPGSRLPMYVAAGILGTRPAAFIAWSLLAVLVWTPLVVLVTVQFGSALTTTVMGGLDVALRVVVTSVLVYAMLRLTAYPVLRCVGWTGCSPDTPSR